MLGFEAILAFESPSTQKVGSAAFPPRPVSAYQSWETARFVQTISADFLPVGPRGVAPLLPAGKQTVLAIRRQAHCFFGVLVAAEACFSYKSSFIHLQTLPGEVCDRYPQLRRIWVQTNASAFFSSSTVAHCFGFHLNFGVALTVIPTTSLYSIRIRRRQPY